MVIVVAAPRSPMLKLIPKGVSGHFFQKEEGELIAIDVAQRTPEVALRTERKDQDPVIGRGNDGGPCKGVLVSPGVGLRWQGR